MEVLFSLMLLGSPPPAQYDHPFKGELVIQRVGRAEANRLCQAHITSRSGQVAACVISVSSRKCHIVLNMDSLHNKDSILRHEIGHCNGWPGHHPR